jgi:hypothetical protein
MRKITLATLLVMMLSVLVGCAPAPAPQEIPLPVLNPNINRLSSEEKMAIANNPNAGNFSWIPYRNSGVPDGPAIVRALNDFERDHSELEVVSFQVHWGAADYDWSHRGWTGAQTYGIWVHHRSKTP